MAVVFRLRGPDGKFVKGNAKNVEKSMTTFASNVIKEGRAILNADKKRTKTNTLFNSYSYNLKSSNSTITLGFDFGSANNYWQFVDQGVQGVGYSDASEDVEQLPMLGTGSPFKFKYASPGGAMVNSIRGWIKNKPASLGGRNEMSAAWSIGYSIKRRGLERTLFYSKPVEKALETLPNDVLEAFRLDFSKLIDKLPNKTIIK
tara:strand:- start:4418 stop:5026 length:609 start_codon:yes stop_codon:yes gene_type:complete